ncbi:hypothetical protein E3N88_20316 [Mikania micrantha]|uniref:Uncharacterized protein n=1 Tax=Mikania micrantha TaxID=192012 RepID=A0A5N6NIH7_9ASTR|nr:hypothetical protein E3N88_20316 [Mikania micrantha]
MRGSGYRFLIVVTPRKFQSPNDARTTFYDRETGKIGPEQQKQAYWALRMGQAVRQTRSTQVRRCARDGNGAPHLAASARNDGVAGDRDVLLDVQELTLTHYFITKVTEELMDIQRCTIGERALGPSCIPVFA